MPDAHEARITRNEEEIQKIETSIEKLWRALSFRPPLWCTFLMMGLSSALVGFIVRAWS